MKMENSFKYDWEECTDWFIIFKQVSLNETENSVIMRPYCFITVKIKTIEFHFEVLNVKGGSILINFYRKLNRRAWSNGIKDWNFIWSTNILQDLLPKVNYPFSERGNICFEFQFNTNLWRRRRRTYFLKEYLKLPIFNSNIKCLFFWVMRKWKINKRWRRFSYQPHPCWTCRKGSHFIFLEFADF